jgi:phage replication-related protein YjqB (UPF0714/DUF867 family)
MHQDEKISSNFRFECNVDYLNIEMISNDKSVNYEVVLNESYHSRVTFICIWGHMKENMSFKKYVVKRRNSCVEYLSLKMISNEKV